jgi:hypothetical protein
MIFPRAERLPLLIILLMLPYEKRWPERVRKGRGLAPEPELILDDYVVGFLNKHP